MSEDKKLEWESIGDNFERAKVFGGWLVQNHTDVYHPENGFSGGGEGWDWRPALCFVPDVKHEWKL